MNKKIIGIIASVFLTGIIVVQSQQVKAQLADQPITGPITSPITSPIESLTPTPTLINTVSTTPTPTQSATPTPTLAPGTKLGGLDLDSYCTNTGNPGLQLSNAWSCANGSVSIDMTAACQWQYHMSNVVANQDIAGNPWSWTCYVPPAPVSTTPTETPTQAPTVTSTETPTPTEEITVTPTPSTSSESPTMTPTPSINSVSPTCTPTPIQTNHIVKAHHNNKLFFPVIHFPKGFPFTFNTSFLIGNPFFVQPAHIEVIHAKICTIHDRK